MSTGGDGEDVSKEQFQDECPGCLPVIIDPTTGQVMPADSPPMLSVMRVWRGTQRFEREAFHRVCCLNSRHPTDMGIMQSIIGRMKQTF